MGDLKAEQVGVVIAPGACPEQRILLLKPVDEVWWKG